MAKETKALVWSRASVYLFAVVLAAMDLCGYGLTHWFLGITRYVFAPGLPVFRLFLFSLYLCSVPAWIVLYRLHCLLRNMEAQRVFVAQNVRALGCISGCCLAAGLICLASGLYYLPFLILAAAALFIALIVRVVRDCFAQAAQMRDELDYTI